MPPCPQSLLQLLLLLLPWLLWYSHPCPRLHRNCIARLCAELVGQWHELGLGILRHIFQPEVQLAPAPQNKHTKEIRKCIAGFCWTSHDHAFLAHLSTKIFPALLLVFSFQCRLYSQAEALCKYYRTPILLIEFDGDKQWGLTHASELGLDIDSRSPGARLSLLLLHFPRLRLVWSRSLHATADMFGALKASGDEPDPAAAAAVGLPEGANAPGSAPAPLINTAALEVLKRMPGVTQAGARNLMATVGSLAEIAQLTLPQLQAAMAGDADRLRALLDGALDEEEEEEAQAAALKQDEHKDGQQGPEKVDSREGKEGQQQQQQQQQQRLQLGANAPQKGGMAGGTAGRAQTLYEFLHAPCPLAG
ncbi:hypothetical protein DUNSADRAFT_11821 [Dunaliella salina]|uniref:ERCC4 domain-containing protein n=1 Tax=Dunaliella salina TaxID=3046 RepID=A0ABQ7GCH7_DUNSA|nr:hypothetical protein DUNSADRAFT_11821 [Dunaliella salina]|eukprot:KAF5832312.1 hypothetical protein DUNSADRAFT_11821 [Dunaliella salina]